MVKGQQFDNYRDTGDPVYTAKVYNAQYVDELVIIDIDATIENRSSNLEILNKISKVCFMPLTLGGGIKTVENIKSLLRVGADKVVINSAAYENHFLIKEGARLFGRQCIVVGLDVKQEDGDYILYKKNGLEKCNVSLLDHIKKMELFGAGEFFLNNITRDGMMKGYDLELINRVASNTNLPVVACGGAGNLMHLVDGFKNTSASGLAMASIYHFGDNNPIRARAYLKNNRIPIKEV